MVTSPGGDGVIMLGSSCKFANESYSDRNLLFRMKASPNGTFQWITIKHELKIKRHNPLIAYIDDSKVNCYQKLTTPNPSTEGVTTEPITTTTTTTKSAPTGGVTTESAHLERRGVS